MNINYQEYIKSIPVFRHIGISENGEFIYYPNCVAALCINQSDEILFVKQYRAVLDKYTYEIPGGIIEQDEIFESAVAREILEEIGHKVIHIKDIIVLDMDVAISKHTIYVYLAIVEATDYTTEVGCHLEKVPKSELLNFILKNEVTHAPTIAAVYWYLNFNCDEKH